MNLHIRFRRHQPSPFIPRFDVSPSPPRQTRRSTVRWALLLLLLVIALTGVYTVSRQNPSQQTGGYTASRQNPSQQTASQLDAASKGQTTSNPSAQGERDGPASSDSDATSSPPQAAGQGHSNGEAESPPVQQGGTQNSAPKDAQTPGSRTVEGQADPSTNPTQSSRPSRTQPGSQRNDQQGRSKNSSSNSSSPRKQSDSNRRRGQGAHAGETDPAWQCSLAAALSNAWQYKNALKLIQAVRSQSDATKAGCSQVYQDTLLQMGKASEVTVLRAQAGNLDVRALTESGELFLISGRANEAHQAFQEALNSCASEPDPKRSSTPSCAGVEAARESAKAHAALTAGDIAAARDFANAALAPGRSQSMRTLRSAALWRVASSWLAGEALLDMDSELRRLAWECATDARCSLPASLAERTWLLSVAATGLAKDVTACYWWDKTQRELRLDPSPPRWAETVVTRLGAELTRCQFIH